MKRFSVGRDMKKLGPSYFAYGNVKCDAAIKNILVHSQKAKVTQSIPCYKPIELKTKT